MSPCFPIRLLTPSVTPMTLLTDDNKVTIQRMKYLEIKWEDISFVVGQSEDCCRQYFYRFRLNKSLPEKTIVTNRILDGYHGLQIKTMLYEDPIMTLRQLAAALDITVSHVTVGKYLKRNGFHAIAASRQIQVSEVNKDKRRVMAAQLFFYEEIWYRDVSWSDEMTIKMWPKNKSLMIWSRTLDPYSNTIIYPNKHSGGISVSFWGCFSYYAWGPLVAYEGTMNSVKYRQMMRRHLLPELVASEESNPTMRFMQDGATCHTCPDSMAFFDDNGVGLYPFHCPQSPDLNPIEWVWGNIKAKLPYVKPFPTTKIELTETVMNMWNEFTDEYRHKLVKSMQERIREVYKRNGDWTKF